MAGTYNFLFACTMELFLMVVRNVALGCATQVTQMGAILAPFVVVLGGGLLFAVFATCGFVGRMLSFYLSETFNLYNNTDGMEDGENEWRRV
ncbi:hypothetical protein L1049_014606 [Liquidambar formosana]|uniref:Uncharacterized protein n=1 Tax=Liquidambar formosana TaxID=63359 RepID=A0AAP0S3J1_LIQFO